MWACNQLSNENVPNLCRDRHEHHRQCQRRAIPEPACPGRESVAGKAPSSDRPEIITAFTENDAGKIRGPIGGSKRDGTTPMGWEGTRLHEVHSNG